MSARTWPEAMDYRIAALQDAPLIAQMNKQLIDDEGHRNPMSIAELEHRMSDWLSGAYTAILFVRGGEPCGYALFRREPDHIYLRQFFVCRQHRRCGVGRAAITWLRRNAWADVPRIRIDVLVGNQAAIAFWRSVGFHDYCLTMESDGDKASS
ncbi:MAG: GNAT family N-acetyltransferase [Tepidisphaeraceae bacterium]